MTTPNDLPPVGATMSFGRFRAEVHRALPCVWLCGDTDSSSLGRSLLMRCREHMAWLDAALTTAWREQQARIAAEQARDSINTEAEMWRREVRERDKTVSQLHDEVTSALAERNYAHERAEEAEARVVELEAVRDQLATDLQGALESARNSGAAQDHMRLYGAETREERDRLKARVAKLEADAARYAYCRTGQWVRRSVSIGWDAATDSELMEERTFLEVPVLKGSDLSCRAWVDRAIDAARAAQGGDHVAPPGTPR